MSVSERIVGATALLAVLALLGCNRTPAPPPPAPAPAAAAPTPAPPAPRAKSEFLNTGPKATYVGTAACAACHADQHKTWQVTAHARSMSEVRPEDEPADAQFDHTASGRRYTVARVDGRLHHRESLVLRDGTEVPLADHPLKYLVGSGRFSRTYLVELDGFLVESPVTWYASRNAWDMSPGYDSSNHDSFRRRASHGCLLCHAGLVEPTRPHGFTFPRGELAIGCERCHGPGSLHVAHRENRKAEDSPADNPAENPIDRTIVNPRHLDRPLAEAICHQCHLQADVKTSVRGRRPGDFRPGLPLWHERIEWRLAGSGPEMTVVGHVEQLQQSRCYQQAGQLTCTTCHDPHDPHEPRAAEARIAVGRTICLGCHEPTACGAPAARRETTRPVADACTTCHMPQVATDIPHIAFTHHRIGVHKKPAPGPADEMVFRGELTTIQDFTGFHSAEQDRMQGLAYLRLHFQRPWKHNLYLSLAERRLGRARDFFPADGELAAATAEIDLDHGRLAAAEAAADRALALSLPTDARVQAAHVKVSVLMQRHRFAAAVGLLEEMTTLRRNPLHWAMLGHCHKEVGEAKQAIAAFEQALAIAPGQGALHRVLVPLYEKVGDDKQVRYHRKQARRLPANGFRTRR